MFGRAEKVLRKKAVITTKEEYNECYQAIGTVKVLGKDWELVDTKSLKNYYTNIENISEMKRIVIKVKEEGDVVENQKKPTKKQDTKQSTPRRSSIGLMRTDAT